MSRLRGALALLLAVGAVLGGMVAVTSATASTQAAWTDSVRATATVTAGTWATPTQNSCTAWDMNGQQLAGCAVTAVEVEQWTDQGVVVRGYTVRFAAPGAMRISYTVDLASPTKIIADGAAFDWSKAVLGQYEGHFSPAQGWTCAQLPTLTAVTREWQTGLNYFTVRQSPNGQPAVCP